MGQERKRTRKFDEEVPPEFSRSVSSTALAKGQQPLERVNNNASSENQIRNSKRSMNFFSSEISRNIQKMNETSMTLLTSGQSYKIQKRPRTLSEESVVELVPQPMPLWIPKQELVSPDEDMDSEKNITSLSNQSIPQEKRHEQVLKCQLNEDLMLLEDDLEVEEADENISVYPDNNQLLLSKLVQVESSPSNTIASIEKLRTNENVNVTPTNPHDSRCPCQKKSLSYLKNWKSVNKTSHQVLKKTPDAGAYVYSFGNLVNNLNRAKQTGATNDFHLENIYELDTDRRSEFKFEWDRRQRNVVETEFNIDDIVRPVDERFGIIFEIIRTVFSKPMNCGYFNEEERNFLFNILTLRQEEQYFFAIFLVEGGEDWFFARERDYDKLNGEKIELSSFMEMLQKGFLENAYKTRDGSFFDVFDDVFLQNIYEKMKGGAAASRRKMISVLEKIFRQEMDNGAGDEPLTSYLYSQKGPMVRVSSILISLAHRILTLYFPNHNPHHDFSHVISIIARALDRDNPTKYPSYSISTLPLFKNRQSLIDYTQAKLLAIQVHDMMEQKPLHYIKKLVKFGEQIKRKLEKLIMAVDGNYPRIPVHIRQFLPTHLLSKMLISIIRFLRTQTTQLSLFSAKQCLTFLRENCKKIPVDKIVLLKEAIAIEVERVKFPQRAGEYVVAAFELLETQNSRLHYLQLMDIAKKLQLNKLAPLTRKAIINRLEQKENFSNLPTKKMVFQVQGEGVNQTRRSWKPINENDLQAFNRLKNCVVNHYIKCGYPKAVKCESLPVTIFASLFWEELFWIGKIPGAFVSRFQEGPLDLFDENFYKSRKSSFERRLECLESMKDDDIWTSMAEVYQKSSSVESIISHSFGDHNDFKGMIKCLKKKGVLDICRKMIKGECFHWGFPDVIAWDESTMRYTFATVRIPRNDFSVAQNLWIKALINLKMSFQEISPKIIKGQ